MTISNIFHGLDTVTTDRLCYGIITRDSIFRVWWSPDPIDRLSYRRSFILNANIAIDLTNLRYIKHRYADPIRLGRVSDEVKILFAHTKRFEFVDNTLKELPTIQQDN